MAWRAVGFAYLSLLGASGEECDVVLLQLAHDLDNTSASTKTLAPNPKEVSPRAAWLRHAVTMLKGPARHGDAMLLGSRSKLAIHAHPLGELFGVSGVALAASSVNLVDVVWLLPFLIIARGTLHAGIFIFISQLWVTLAIIAWSLGGGVLESQPGMERDADYILGSLILLYAVVMYVQEKHADVDCDYESRFTTGTFILLTLAGTVDQILVYGPLLATESLSSWELELGILMASLITLGLALLTGKSSCIQSAVKALPLWLLLTFMGLAAMVEGMLVTMTGSDSAEIVQ
ncbi:unnamed protein product [Effrenium voratum]|uniref:Uncharacterized protein n=1 Tax=Effrenium voratum TaxID=2562239 RepID=A0AA36IS60_9DINO|nr:unnamed protein product [Effrenium voratum]CAJ1457300.1 unnamed protein product [Effrenium voratum]